ncbi:DNA cytosine methyltransferase [Chryseobacterium carnipullorum]|uniref:Cytosine-specific methyltransferase n=1 Tax=Chryseobacterium carnipullorum TaxID=1124835 RepID=A0A3G6NIK8_CHRCU|nr:DNA cytosine methyltransferase [Chryseobacterium carnipullorum]AZA67702.1 DNA cytosine methyltransferase [Chryseobacterium carnipullorum]
MNILELFSGIGGFSKGFEDAGFEIKNHYFSEIDKHAIANYKHNFPNAKFIGSVVDISGRDFTGVDIITFGSPCQDFSLAGKREGMDGQRSVLILEAIRLVTELRPSVFIWENVKGAFSSNSGADFWGILQAFANIGGYRLEWQLLNTKWFLPQNRERIYLVGHLTGRSVSGVFPIGEDDIIPSFEKESEKGRSQTKYSATTLRAGNMKATDTYISVPIIAGTLTAGGNSGGLHSDMTTIQINPSKESGGVQPYQQNRVYSDKGLMVTLDLDHRKNVETKGQYRRMTEIEWERLQGFPDNWTELGNYDGIEKKIPKTQRYKMLGNAVTVKVVEEIAKRL